MATSATLVDSQNIPKITYEELVKIENPELLRQKIQLICGQEDLINNIIKKCFCNTLQDKKMKYLILDIINNNNNIKIQIKIEKDKQFLLITSFRQFKEEFNEYYKNYSEQIEDKEIKNKKIENDEQLRIRFNYI